MKDILDKKIKDLAKEASELTDIRMNIQQQFKEIDTRLTQISGAIVELQKIQHDLQGDKNGSKASINSESKVSRSISKT